MLRSKNARCLWILEFMEIVTRAWGLVTAVVLWGVGADLTVHKHDLGIYILVLAGVLSVLETSFVVNIFLDLLVKDDKHVCWRCHRAIQWIDLWKKTLLYAIFSIFCFFKPARLWLANVAGGVLIILALFYIILTYKVHLTMTDALVLDRDSSYDRFEDFQEEIDDSLPEPSGANVGDQNDILQV